MRALLQTLPCGWAAQGLTVALLIVMAGGLVPVPVGADTPVVRFEVERFAVEGDNPLSP